MYDATDIEPTQVAEAIRQDLITFLQPLLAQLDAQIDRRLVQTFARTIDAILCFRNRPHGLLLSELGGYLLDPEHAAAGTKRLSNLLRSSKWSAQASETFLWQRATTFLEELEQQGEDALVLWDERHPHGGYPGEAGEHRRSGPWVRSVKQGASAHPHQAGVL
jgi:hypothetical protein